MPEHSTTPGYLTGLRVGVQSAFGTPVAASDILLHTREGFSEERPREMSPGPLGARAVPVGRSRQGLLGVRGGFVAGVPVDQFDLFAGMMFPYNSGVNYAFHNTGTPVSGRLYTFEIDKVAGDYEVSDARCNTIELTSAANDLDLKANAEFVAVLFGADGSPTGGLSEPADAIPQHYHSVLTVNSVAIPTERLAVRVNHMLKLVYRNSRRLIAIPHGIRVFEYEADIDWNSVGKTAIDALYAEPEVSIPIQAKWAIGTKKIQFDSAQAKIETPVPEMDIGDEPKLVTARWRAWSSAVGAEDDATCVISMS